MMNFVKRTLITLCLLLSGVVVYAQPTDPQTDPDNPIPITGLEYLILGGGLMGGYKIFKKGRKNKGIVSETDK